MYYLILNIKKSKLPGMVYHKYKSLCYHLLMNNFILDIESELVSFDLPQAGLKQVLDTLILSNAKRIRPKLAYLFIKSNNEDISTEQKKLIAAGEVLHTASLIHDDIVDASELRRGVPTINVLYDSKLAVLAGDFLASYGMKKIISINNMEIINIFQAAFEKMCRAEIFQYFSRGAIPSMNEYIKKSSDKTAALFAAILQGCAILSANIDTETSYNLGISYGIAFQIKNDLDAFINTPQRDKKNGTYTAPDIYYSQLNNFNSAIEKTYTLIDNMQGETLKIINNFPDNNYKEQLIKLIEESLCKTISR